MSEEEKIMLETNRSITNMETCFRNKIKELQHENNQLKENNLAMQEEMCRTWEKLNIIKDLRSWLEDKTKEPISYNLLYDGKQKAYKEVLSKLNELEGVSNE